jgi:hypothetical protein
VHVVGQPDRVIAPNLHRKLLAGLDTRDERRVDRDACRHLGPSRRDDLVGLAEVPEQARGRADDDDPAAITFLGNRKEELTAPHETLEDRGPEPALL